MILNGNALHLPIASGTVQTCVTSPPYYGLRSYLDTDNPLKHIEIGLEPTPEEYIANMVAVFREVKRVLRDDGTLWLNIGDSYASSTKGSGGPSAKQDSNAGSRYCSIKINHGVKDKDLIGIPWLLAFALRADGWWLRQDIIWAKPNPMPESVTDRCTKSHEYIFLLSKSQRYYYDNVAVMEPVSPNSDFREKPDHCTPYDIGTGKTGSQLGNGSRGNPAGRNKRDVWTIATQPYSEAHFATYPPKLIEPCILAGTSDKGACPECGAPWERVVEKIGGTIGKGWTDHKHDLERGMSQDGCSGLGNKDIGNGKYRVSSIGWQPSCTCNAGEPVPCIVLDPFNGSGTTGLVALKHRRRYIGVDLSMEYLAMSKRRTAEIDVMLPGI